MTKAQEQEQGQEPPADDQESEGTETVEEEETETEPQPKPKDGKEPPEPPKTIEEANTVITRLRAELHKTNREAARRRLEAKKTKETTPPPDDGKKKDEKPAESDRLAALEREIASLKTQRDTATAEVRFASVTKKAGVTFASDKASQDAFRFARELMSETDAVDEEGEPLTLETALKQVLEDRPYLAKKVKPVNSNDQERGERKDLIIDEAAVASRFGIKIPKTSGGK